MKTETKIATLQIIFAGIFFATWLGFFVMAISDLGGPIGMIVPLIMAFFAVPYFVAEYDIYFNLRYFLTGRGGRMVYKDVFNGISCTLSAVIVVSFPWCVVLNVSAVFDMDTMWIWLGCYIVFRSVYGVVGLVVNYKRRAGRDSCEV